MQVLGSKAIRMSDVPTEIRDTIMSEFIIPFCQNLPPSLHNARWYVAIEGNHSRPEANIYASAFTSAKLRVPVVLAPAKEDSRQIGPWTTYDTKMNAISLIHSHMENNTLFLDPKYFGDKNTLSRQLKRVRKVTAARKTEAGTVYTAKITGKTRSSIEGDTEDDQAISFLIAIYNATSLLMKIAPAHVALRWEAIHEQKSRVARALMNSDEQEYEY